MRRLAELSDLESIFANRHGCGPFLKFDPMPIEAFQPVFREYIMSRIVD
jgi:putative acetyltransferase